MNQLFAKTAATIAMATAPATVLAQQQKPAPEVPQYRLAISTNSSCAYMQDNKGVDLKSVTVIIKDLTIPNGLPGAGATLPKGTTVFEYRDGKKAVFLDAKGQAVIGVPGTNQSPVVTNIMKQDATALNRDCVTQVSKYPGTNAWTPNQ